MQGIGEGTKAVIIKKHRGAPKADLPWIDYVQTPIYNCLHPLFGLIRVRRYGKKKKMKEAMQKIPT